MYRGDSGTVPALQALPGTQDPTLRAGSSLSLQRKTLKFREIQFVAKVTQLLSGIREGQRAGPLPAWACAPCRAHVPRVSFDTGFSEPGGAGPGGSWS